MIRMLTLDTKTSLYVEDRGLQVPMTLDHGKNWGDSVFVMWVVVRLFVSLNKDRVEGH